MGGERQAVGADLVGHAAVGRDPVRAGQHHVHLPAGQQRGGGRVGQHGVRQARPAGLPRGQPGALEQRPGLVDPEHGQPAGPVRGHDHRERGPLPRGHQRAGVAVGQHPGARRDQAQPVLGHRRAGRGVLRGDPLRLGQRRGRPVRAAAGLLPGGQRETGTPGQVHRGGPGPAEGAGRGGHVVTAPGGQGHAVRPG